MLRRTILLPLLALLLLAGPSHAQNAPLADGALPPQLVTIRQLEPNTEVIAFKSLNPAREIEIKRGGSSTIITGRDSGYLGILVEWYVAPRPAPGSTYIVIERFHDGSQKAWGPYSYDPQAAQAEPPGPGGRAYAPLLVQ